MEIPILILVVIAVAAFVWMRQRNRVLSPAEVENVKRRVRALEERANTQFVATPGDPRLKAGWKYMVALQKRGEDSFTFTFFTNAGISHTQSGMSEEAIFALKDKGWHINAQRLTNEGMKWQLERPASSRI